jgi:predicted DNA-binding antitoxin AbrB/MazE fold protein
MTTTIEATYENGVLKPAKPLALREGQHVRLTISDEDRTADSDGAFTAVVSEEALGRIWNDPTEDEAWAHL